jgi:aspartyl-tRNA(Asn)/glutamyl-tRNA(Gln) amidotransferase subunit A
VGVLDGVPTSIKDLILTKGWPTLRGSRTVDPNQAWDVDAPATARLREAGAVLLGKTTTPEFGCKGETNSPLTGISRNPWDPSKTPGGSSGGTAAAVAAGMGPLSVGTDGAGSVRIPAAFCGNFGLKPSFGRVPAYPLSPMGTVAHLGPHTMSVRDAALMMNVLKQPDARDWTSLPPDDSDYLAGLDDGIRGLKIAYSPALGFAKGIHPEVAAAVQARCSSCRTRAPSSNRWTRASTTRCPSPSACGSPAPGRSGTRCRPSNRRWPTRTSPARPSRARSTARSNCIA